MKAPVPGRTASLALIGFLIGGLSGFWLRASLTEIPTTVVLEQPANGAEPDSTVRKNDKPLTVETPVTQEKPDESLNAIDYEKMFARLEAEGLRLVPKKVLFHLGKKPIQEDGSISPGVAEALRLSSAEIARAEATLKSVREELAALEMERVEKISAKDDDIVFRIHPFPAEGAKLHNRLQTELAERLGEAKGKTLVELIDDDTYLDGFGATPVEVRFMIVNHGSEPQAAFSTRQVPDDDSAPHWVFKLNPNEQPNVGRHGHLLRRLPPELRAFYDEPQ